MSALSVVGVLAFAASPVQAVQQPALAIEPSRVQLEVDATRTLSLRPLPVDTTVVRWISRDPSVARVDPDGTVRGLGPGTARILAIAGEHRAEAVIVVPALPPATVDARIEVAEVLAGTGAPLR